MMNTNTGIMRTRSEQKTSNKYVKMTIVHLAIKCHIEKFWPHVSYHSEAVTSQLAPNAYWQLAIRMGINGITEGHLYHVTQPVVRVNDWETLEASFHIYFVGEADGKIDSVCRGTKKFGYGTARFSANIQDYVMRALRMDGSLMLVADIEYPAPDQTILHGYEEKERWMAKFYDYFQNEIASDCQIQIGSTTLQAHKFPLMAQSPVFRAMFSSKESKESQSGVVEVTDFDNPEPMRGLLLYCYQGQLNSETMDGEWATAIFELADKYGITDLKSILEKHFIERTLSVGNVVELAELADMHSAEKLKKACIKLIARERKTVLNRADWKELQKANPTLAVDLAVAACLKE